MPTSTLMGGDENYKKILLKTNATIDSRTGKVKSSSVVKYNTIVKPIYRDYYKDPLLPRRTQQASPLSPALRKVPATATLLPPKTGKKLFSYLAILLH